MSLGLRSFCGGANKARWVGGDGGTGGGGGERRGVLLALPDNRYGYRLAVVSLIKSQLTVYS